MSNNNNNVRLDFSDLFNGSSTTSDHRWISSFQSEESPRKQLKFSDSYFVSESSDIQSPFLRMMDDEDDAIFIQDVEEEEEMMVDSSTPAKMSTHQRKRRPGGSERNSSLDWNDDNAVSDSVFRPRRRHFSLEDYSHGDDNSNDSLSSSSSHQSDENIEPNSSSFKLHSSLFPEQEDEGVSLDTTSDLIYAQLLSEIEEKLRRVISRVAKISSSSECNQNKVITLPEGLITVIAKHVIQEASGEPCGLKGCRIILYYEGFSDIHFLGNLICDPNTVPTFTLTLKLRQVVNSWGSSLLSRRGSQSAIHMSTSYKLVKKCLYRDDETPISHDLINHDSSDDKLFL